LCVTEAIEMTGSGARQPPNQRIPGCHFADRDEGADPIPPQRERQLTREILVLEAIGNKDVGLFLSLGGLGSQVEVHLRLLSYDADCAASSLWNECIASWSIKAL
jgi:hypothetical protein